MTTPFYFKVVTFASTFYQSGYINFRTPVRAVLISGVIDNIILAEYTFGPGDIISTPFRRIAITVANVLARNPLPPRSDPDKAFPP